MMRVAVQPAPASLWHRSQAAPMPSSPFAFFAENDLLRLWLRALNAILAAYAVAMVTLLTSSDSCSGRNASFYCDPSVGYTRFALAVRNIHSVVAIYFAFCAWHLRFPRRCVVLLNVTVLAVWGLTMVALGVSQRIAATYSANETAPTLVGVQLIILGIVTTVGGGYGGWKYHKRRMMEMLVVVDVLMATQ